MIFGTDYWDSVLNVDAMVEWGTISKKDLELFHFSDDVEDAFNYLTSRLEG